VKELRGRVAVVTGGASGIGLALAQRFVAEGAKVVVGDIEKGALDDAVSELTSSGGEVLGVVTDVTDPAQMQVLADATIDRFGVVDVFCNNAGVGGGGISWEASLGTWEWVLGVNLWGVIHGVRTFVPLLLQRPEGHIVNTASVAGLVAAPFMGAYNASKHAVVAISETLHHELGMMGPHVKVSVLCPGWVNTRIGEADRNRPAHLADPSAPDQDEGAAPMREMLQQMLSDGMPPEVVAGKVLDAIRADRFWILTHDDEDDMWVQAVNRRIESLTHRSNPALNLLA
jgi:NAD(P)-dependent dehydrogenase (short-subunit alcohol dehydrogenase family)